MNGIIIINKEKGYTSHDIVAKAKKILNLNKVGHTGTLDPNATGVLPLLLNDSTKLSKYLIEHDKEYEVQLKLGIKKDTADSEGKIVEEDKNINLNNIDEKYISDIINSFIGKQQQMPPIYSAIKVNGKKLYEYARKSEDVEIRPRNIEIYNIKILNIDKDNNIITFKVECSKGTYIRSLCEDIANKIGTIGYMKELKRLRVGRFKITNSITIEDLENKKDDINFINKHIITMEELLKDYRSINLNNKELEKFLNGMKLEINTSDGLYNIYNDQKYVGTGVVYNCFLKRDIVENKI